MLLRLDSLRTERPILKSKRNERHGRERDFKIGRWVRCRIGSASMRRFVCPAAEYLEAGRAVKAPGLRSE